MDNRSAGHAGTHRQGRTPARRRRKFLERVLIIAGITAAFVAGFLLVWQAANVFLLVFAGILLAVFLRGLAGLLTRATSLPAGWSLALVLLALAVLLGAGGWYLGSAGADQLDQLSQGLINSSRQLEQSLRHYQWGRQLLSLPAADRLLSHRSDVLEQITGVFSTTLGVVGNAAVILFLGIYLAVSPADYRAGLLHLVPVPRRQRAGQILDRVGSTLRWWILGRVLDMAVVGVLTTLGLYLLGIPVPLALGALAFLLDFVPYIGPLLSAIPAVLIALTVGPEHALYVALLYLGIQVLESYLLQPLIQQRSVDLLPALTLSAQVLLGVLLGTLGVMLATPLAAATLVLVRMLYVEDVLGDLAGSSGDSPQGQTPQQA